MRRDGGRDGKHRGVAAAPTKTRPPPVAPHAARLRPLRKASRRYRRSYKNQVARPLWERGMRRDGGAYTTTGTPWLASSVRISKAARWAVRSSRGGRPGRSRVRSQAAILQFRQVLAPPGGLP